MERVVQITYEGRVYTFRADERLPLAFWRVEVEGYTPYRSPIRVTGDERSEFFRGIVEVAAKRFRV